MLFHLCHFISSSVKSLLNIPSECYITTLLIFIYFSSPRGHVAIIVNVASKWGFTNVNYTELQALQEKYGETHGLRILAFPCNQFGSQVSFFVLFNFLFGIRFNGIGALHCNKRKINLRMEVFCLFSQIQLCLVRWWILDENIKSSILFSSLQRKLAQSAGAVEYTHCIFAQG